MGFSIDNHAGSGATLESLDQELRAQMASLQGKHDSISEALLANLTATEEQIHPEIDVMEQEHDVAMTEHNDNLMTTLSDTQGALKLLIDERDGTSSALAASLEVLQGHMKNVTENHEYHQQQVEYITSSRHK